MTRPPRNTGLVGRRQTRVHRSIDRDRDRDRESDGDLRGILYAHVGQWETPTLMTMDAVTAMDAEQMSHPGLRGLQVDAIFGGMDHSDHEGGRSMVRWTFLRCHHQVCMAMAGEGRSQAGATSRRG